VEASIEAVRRYFAVEERPHNSADDSSTSSPLSSPPDESPTDIAVAGSLTNIDKVDIAGREGDATSDSEGEDTDGVWRPGQLSTIWEDSQESAAALQCAHNAASDVIAVANAASGEVGSGDVDGTNVDSSSSDGGWDGGDLAAIAEDSPTALAAEQHQRRSADTGRPESMSTAGMEASDAESSGAKAAAAFEGASEPQHSSSPSGILAGLTAEGFSQEELEEAVRRSLLPAGAVDDSHAPAIGRSSASTSHA
jgi:hypothetical protein